MGNYPRYFEEYYNIVKNKHQININPVEEALDEFEWYRRIVTHSQSLKHN